MKISGKGERTLQSLIGERIMPRLEIGAYQSDDVYRARVQTWVGEHHVGGFCIFGGDLESVAKVSSELQQIARSAHGTPLICAADCEWGLPMRLKFGGTEFPDAMAIARSGDVALAYKIGRAIAEEMSAIGIEWNFAPVADVNSNPNNPIINTRSFSESADVAAEFVRNFIAGTESMHVAATAKHFPGHGDTLVDSHHRLPRLDLSFEEFQQRELIPFASAIGSNVRAIMPGHIAAPELAKALAANTYEQTLPATLSKTLLTGLLRTHMKFEGVIVTDALEMSAITNGWGIAESVVLSAKAGADILLMPSDPDIAYEALLAAAEKGEFSAEELVECCDRIEALKSWVQIPKEKPSISVVGSREHKQLAIEAAKRAIEIIGDSRELRNAKHLFVLTDQREEAAQKAERFLMRLLDSGLIQTGNVYTPEQLPEDLRITEDHAIAVFHRARGYLGGVDISATVPNVLKKIAAHIQTTGIKLPGLLLIGSPYSDRDFQQDACHAIVKTYSESQVSIDAMFEAVWGRPIILQR